MAFPLLTTLALQNIDVLRAIEAGGPPATKAGLAKQLGRDKSNLNKTLDILCEADLLDNGLDLTDRGRQALAAYDRAQGAGGDLAAPHAAFAPHPLNPRKDFASEAAAEALEALSRDIVERGQDHNIVVFPAGADGVFPIWKGERRWRAIGLAIARGDWLPDRPIRYIVGEPPDAAARLIGALAENIQRESLNPIEEAVAFKHLRDVEGLKTDEIAAKISKTQRFVQLRIQLLDAPAITQVELAAGKITVQKALEAVQTRRAATEPAPWEPSHAQALMLVEIARACGQERRCTIARMPSPHKDLTALVYNAAVGYGGAPCKVFLGDHSFDILDRLGLDPRTNLAALFTARQRAGLANIVIKDLEAAGRYHTDWLNQVEVDELYEPPARDAFAAQVHQAAAELEAEDGAVDEAEPPNQEMFPGYVGELRAEVTVAPAPSGSEPVAAPKRDPLAAALWIMESFGDTAAGMLVAIDHDDSFGWADAATSALAARMAECFRGGDVVQLGALAAALYARGGDIFSQRALMGEWRRALMRAFAIALDDTARLGFCVSAEGDIVDAQEGGLLATVEEGVSLEDSHAMAAGPELRRALLGLLAVRPINHDDDEDPEAAAAWSYAAQVAALSEPSE